MTLSVGTGSNVVVASRDVPFLKYRVDEVRQSDGLMTVEQVLEAAGAAFEVEKRKVYTHTAKGFRVTIPDTFATVRTDTEEALGVVGKKYEIVQTREALDPIAEALGGTGLATVESGWALRGGRRVGVTFRVPSLDIDVPGDLDGNLQMWIMVQTSHDGDGSVRGDLGPTRPACVNMFRLVENAAEITFKVRHTSGAKVKLSEAERILGIAKRYRDALEADVQKLLTVELVESQVRDILKAAFPIAEDASPAQFDRSVQAQVLVNWRTSPTIDAIRGTGWGLVNAANEYFEHLAPVRTTTHDADSVRAISILQGTAAQATNRVAATIREYAEVA